MKALIVGLGAIGQRHVRNLRLLLGNGVEFLACRVRHLSQTITPELTVDPNRDVEHTLGVRAFNNAEEALEQKPTMALICNPTSLHLPVALLAANAGCHIFVEKPLSASLAGVDDLARELDRRQLVGLVGYQMRFHPCLRRVRELLAAAAVGAIIAVHAHVGEDIREWHKYEDYRQSYAARSDLGGGTILTQIHEIDYLFWFFGMPRRLFSVGGHLSRLELDVEDTANILMEYHILGKHVPVHIHQNYLQRPAKRTLEIIGDAGTISVDLMTPSLSLVDAQGRIVEATVYNGFERNHLFIEEMRHFLNCMQGQESPLVSLRDGARSLEIALASKASLISGRVVELTDGNLQLGA